MANSTKKPKHLKLEPLDANKFIKVNKLKPITNPVYFDRTGVPTPDGLLSNEIFGVTASDRTEIFSYIELAGETFLHPLAYKTWCRLDSNVKMCVFELDNFRLDKETGKLVLDPNGGTGLKFLRKIIKDVDFKKTQSIKREVNINFLETFRDNLFMDNLIVLPAGYRDVNTEQSRLGVGEVNKLYDNVLRDVNALKESEDYGLSMNGSLRGRIQEGIVAIYDWICFGRFNGVDSPATGLSRKLGLIRRAGMRRTFDWGARLVICSQNLRVESLDDLEIDTDSIGIPLAALCANFYPYMLYHIRQYFENNLSFVKYMQVMYMDEKDKKKPPFYADLVSWREEFSDERIKKELDSFMHGSSNRFVPIEMPIADQYKGKYKPYLTFKGRYIDSKKAVEDYQAGKIVDVESYPLIERPMTWADLFYRAAKEIVKDKMTLITRYPMDSYWNQFPARIVVISTIETEPMIINGKLYKTYPKIRKEDILKNSSNKWVDVATPNNARLGTFGADFDGDTISSKTPFSIEANQELYDLTNSKMNYIGLTGINEITTTKEGLQSLYNLTLVLPEDKDKMTKLSLADFGY